MLRINVAQDQFTRNGWIVHLFARDGDEHIYQFITDTPATAARMALDNYDAKHAGLVKIVQIIEQPDFFETNYYPDHTGYTRFTVDG